jgi:hypothetical protein
MNKLYRNPGAWLSVLLFAGYSFWFFRYFPIVASVLYGGLILFFVTAKIRSSLRFRRLGYRVRWSGRESFYYEEIAAGQIRGLPFGWGSVARGKIGIYWPSREAWQKKMPDWAKSRREEIFDRIRDELGSRLVKIVETE